MEYIRRFIVSKRKWIAKKQRLMNERSKIPVPQIEERSEESIFDRVSYYSNLTGLVPDKVRISNAKTRWGSCYKNNISLSKRLTLIPIEVADYIVVHELVHLKIKNHSKEFWQKVGEIYPNYRQAKRWLREYNKVI